MNEDQQIEQPVEPGAAGAPEGAATDPTTDEIAELYRATGVKAPVPTGKPKGRPKTADVRAKDGAKDRAADSDTGKQGDDDDKSQSKDAPAANKDGNSRNSADAKSSKNSKDDGQVQAESGEADDGVREPKSRGEGDSERGGEEDAERGDDGTGQEAHESGDKTEEGKRPGKSNPEIERRFQKLSEERRERDEEISRLRQELEQATQQQAKLKVSQEDPEYSIEDFLKVRDEEGNVIDLDRNQAELAWRRWKDGYDARSEQRNAEQNRQAAEVQRQQEMSESIMRNSVAAYDRLASLMDDFPELVSDSGQYNKEFAAKALPIVQKSIVYVPDTEPGNAAGNQPVVAGLRIDPRDILEAMRGIQQEKRALPLNGVDDTVESRSNVNVPHRRSSDPTINAANELYRELNINKRL